MMFYKDRINTQVFNSLQNTTLLIGKIDSRGVYYMPGTSHILLFDVELLCDEPRLIKKHSHHFKEGYILNEIYTGFVREQNSKCLPQFFSSIRDYDEQIEELNNHFFNRYVIFVPDYIYDDNNGDYHKNLIITELKEIPPTLNANTQFSLIPRVNVDEETFEQMIHSGEYFTLEHIPGNIYDHIAYVMCGSHIYFSDSWEYDKEQPKNWRCAGGIKEKCSIDLRNNQHIISIEDYNGIVFIDEQYLRYLQEDQQFIQLEEIIPVKKDIKHVNYNSEEAKKEIAMLKSFNDSVIAQNLCYEYEDLVNLHICIKSSLLTILAGMSGTGKTQLALQYAQMLDATEEQGNLLFLPISPSYTEPDDVIGFLNPATGLYVPSETGLVDLLLEAKAHPERMHVVIFDEMNLSQIEHWFSPFISVLEKDSESRYLTLYNKKTQCRNSNIYPDKIKISNNIIFIGTINLDETTKDISDRLLDRSFVINLKKKKFTEYYDQNQYITKKTKSTCESASLFNTWRSGINPIAAFTFEELEFLDTLHEIISAYNEQKGVSFRVLKNIGSYINNIPYNEGELIIDRKHAFDLVLKQTVLKKISGPENRIGNLIGKISSIKEEVKNSELMDLFNAHPDISDFKECKEALKRKAEDLLTYGYTR